MGLPQDKKPELATHHGYLGSSYKRNQEAISGHTKSTTHMNIISRLKSEKSKRQRTEIAGYVHEEEMNDDGRLLITARMFRTVFVLNKLSLAYSDHAGLVTLQKLNGLDMGFHHYERTACTKMSNFISDIMHDILIKYLIENQMPISIIVDDTTDLSTVHFKIVYFQTIEDNRPVIYFYKLIELKAETGQAHFDVVRSAWENESPGFLEYMKENLVGFASDGASVNVGRHNGMITYLKNWASKPLFAVHCMAHRLELLIHHAFDINKEIENISHELDRALNDIYKFYGGLSHKRKTHLKQTSDMMKKTFYELKRIIEIRWITSDYNAMKSLYSMWPVIIRDLTLIGEDNDFQISTKDKARQLKKRLIGKHFLLYFNLIYDIVSELSLLSLDMQKRSALLVDANSFIRKFKGVFTNMKTMNAKNLAIFLHEARCEKIDINERCESLQDYLDSGDIHYQDIRLLDDTDKFPTFKEYKETLLIAILNEFERYFPDGDLSKFDVLDPDNMPLPNDESGTRTYGIVKISEINDHFKISDNDDILIQEWQGLLQSIVTSENYCQIRTEKTSISAFWSQLLKWPEIIWGERIKRLVKTILAIPISSAEAERGFSTLKYLRDSRRSRLIASTMDTMLRIKLNGPDELDHFPAPRYADAWIKSGKYATDYQGNKRAEATISHSLLEEENVEAKRKYLLKSTLF